MTDEELDAAMNSMNEFGSMLRSSKQKHIATQSKDTLKKLESTKRRFEALSPRIEDFMAWASAKEFIDKNRYGLSPDDRFSMGMDLMSAEEPALKMAGVDLVAESTQKRLAGTSSRFINQFKAIMGEGLNEDSPDLAGVEAAVAKFRESVAVLFESAGGVATCHPSEQVVQAVKAAKTASAMRDLKTWQVRKFKSIAELHQSETEELMAEVEPHLAIDGAIASICEGQGRDESGELNLGGQFLPSVCNFAFGMALEFSDRAESKDAPEWTLQLTVASAASSLIRHGVIESAVTYFLSRFYEALFNPNPSNLADDARAWIHVGVQAMDRLCRTGSNQLAEDFKKCSLIFAGSQS